MDRMKIKGAGALVAVGLAVIIGSTIAHATNNTTIYHRHTRDVTYKNLASIPSGWYAAIAEAAVSWTERANMNITYDEGSWDWVRYEEYPEELWDDCPPATSQACTDGYIDSSNHIIFTDIYFNANVTFGTNTFNCVLNYPDVQETAAHELGHAFGWLRHSTTNPDVMAAQYYSGCFRIPTEHDVASMNYQRRGH